MPTHKRTHVVAASLLGLGLLAGCSSTPAQTASAPRSQTPSTTTAASTPEVSYSPTEEPTETPTPEPTFDAKPADFKIGIKIMRKKCFGSAGCNVTYRIDPTYIGDQEIPDSGTVEVTYAVKGLSDGEAVNSFTIEGGQASFDSEEDGETTTSSSKLSARATDVSFQP